MKKLLFLLALGLACRQSAPRQLTGAATPRAAVDQLMLAIRAQDLQAISAVWGNAKGPARDQYAVADIEKRELLMVCYFNHDSYTITSETQLTNKKRVILAAVKKGDMTRMAEFILERGPSDRWYASSDVTPLKDFCQPRRTG